MDYQSYVSMFSNRGDVPLRDVNGYPYALHAFRQDLLSNKVVWSNNYKQDLRFRMKTHHSVLSIVFASKYHPYTRIYRFIIFISSLCLSVLSSAIITCAPDNTPGDIIYLSILSAILISVYNAFTKWCLVCSCAESSNRCYQFFCKSVGFCVAIYCQLFNAVLYLIAAIGILKAYNDNNSHFWIVWIVSNTLTYSLELLIIAIYFKYRWNIEHKLFAQGTIQAKLNYFVTFDEYENWTHEHYQNLSLSSSIALSEEEYDDPMEAKTSYVKVDICDITPQRL